MKFFLYLYMLLFSVFLFSQEIPVQQIDSVKKEYFMVKGDTIFKETIDLDDVVMLKKIKFSSKQDRIKYLILRRKVRKVYPYAKMAADRLTELKDSLEHIKSKRRQKKYTKHIQKYIEEEFSEKLKKFSRTEGQILVS